jgi:GxxExxY protein
MSPIESHDERTYAIIGAAFAVHTELGSGFLEPVYQAALAKEFTLQKIPFEKEVSVPICYKNELLDLCYRADFICFGSVLVELKAISALGKPEEAQIINYLKATHLEVGLLLNFGSRSAQCRRFSSSRNKSASSAKSADHGFEVTSLPVINRILD